MDNKKKLIEKIEDAWEVLKGTKIAEEITPISPNVKTDPTAQKNQSEPAQAKDEPQDALKEVFPIADDTISSPQVLPKTDKAVASEEQELMEQEAKEDAPATLIEDKKQDTEPDTTPAPSSIKGTDKDTQTQDFNNPEVRVKTSIDIDDNSFIVGMSIQGRSHIGAGTACQDFHSFTTLAPGWYLAITSDGAGSARESARGSKANCESASKLVTHLVNERKWIETNYLPSDKEWYIEIRNIFEMIQELIIRKVGSTESMNAQASGEPLKPRDFNATIILLLMTPRGMLTAHIGDGRMGYLSATNEWIPLMTPHKGDEASETVFIPNNWNRQMQVPIFTMSNAFLPDTKVIEERPKAFVLMSDGCENFTWQCTAYDKEKQKYYDPNLPFEGFLNPLIDEMNAIKECDKRVERLIDIINIGTTEARKEQDDRTLLLGVFN